MLFVEEIFEAILFDQDIVIKFIMITAIICNIGLKKDDYHLFSLKSIDFSFSESLESLESDLSDSDSSSLLDVKSSLELDKFFIFFEGGISTSSSESVS